MIKTDYFFEKVEPYEVMKRYGNIAEIKSNKDLSALMDMTTKQIVAPFDKYVRTIYDEKTELLFQIKEGHINGDGYKRLIRIYDVKNNKLLCDGWDITCEISKNQELMILEDPKTEKYHIFNKSIYRSENNGFNSELDKVNYLSSQKNVDFLSTEKYGKEAFYTSKNGFESGYTYDDIKVAGQAIIFESADMAWFNFYDGEGNLLLPSSIYNNVETVDPFICCNYNSKIYVFYKDDENDICRLAFSTEADSLSVIDYKCRTNDSTDYFLALEHADGFDIALFGINEDGTIAKPLELLTPDRFDDLQKDNNRGNGITYVVKKDYKDGLLIYDNAPHYTKPIYDKGGIYLALSAKICIGYKGEVCDIFNPVTGEVLVTNCKADVDYNSIVFNKNGKYGVVDLAGVSEMYDDITRKPGNYFITEKNGKQGLLYGSRTIFKPKFVDIDVCGSTFTKQFFLKCKKDNGKYDLFKYSSVELKEAEKINTDDLNDVEFRDGFAILKYDEKIVIYSYLAGIIKTFAPDTSLVTTKISDKDVNGNIRIKEVVNVDGDDYRYLENTRSFDMVPTSNKKVYASTFEGEFGTVFICEEDKKAYDDACKRIFNMTDDGFDKVLSEMYESRAELKMKYPGLKGDK